MSGKRKNIFRKNIMARLLATTAVSGCMLAAPTVATAQEDAVVDDQIVVTGTLIKRRSQAATASPLQTFGAEDFDAQGATTITDLVKNITANAGSEFNTHSLSQPLTSGTAQFNLRNLGLNSTLVLINGRRQTVAAVAATDGSTFVDINSLLPTIMIDRIEILKDGAAATYGSDAVAGVVNFITRNDFEGAKIKANYGKVSNSDSDEWKIEGLLGFATDTANLVAGVSYLKRSVLRSTERDFSTAENFGFAGWHAVSSYGQPGSFFLPSAMGFSPDPDCSSFFDQGAFQNSPADLCRFDFSPYFELSPDEERGQVFATADIDISDTMRAGLEMAYSSTKTDTIASPSFPFLTFNPTVPASHPDNPFGEDVRFRGRIIGADGGPSMTSFEYETYRFAGFLEGEFSSSWEWRANGTFSQQTVDYQRPDTLVTPTVNALRGLGGPNCDPVTGTPGVGDCQYFNPFGSARLGTGTPNDPALVQSLLGSTDLDGMSSLITLEGIVSGELFDLGDRAVGAALGVQYRKEEFSHDWGDLYNAGEFLTLGQAPDFSDDRNVFSVFGEVIVPVMDTLEVQLSGRYEDYSSGFSSFDPKVAVLFRPNDYLSLRGSYGTSFRAPSIYQTSAVQASQPFVIDGGFVFVNVQTFGNPNLEPEEANVLNLGATFSPTGGDSDWGSLTFNLDFWKYDYSNLIVKESAQALVNAANADTLAGLMGTENQIKVERDAGGLITRIVADFVNASSVDTSGIDFGMEYSVDLGDVTLGVNSYWTHIFKYDIQQTAGGAVIDGAGNVNFENFARSLPEWRGYGNVSLNKGAHTLNVFARYISSYENDRAFFNNTIDDHFTIDLQYQLSLRDIVGTDTTFRVGAINVTNEDPPFAQLILGYDPTSHDPRGRVLYFELEQGF